MVPLIFAKTVDLDAKLVSATPDATSARLRQEAARSTPSDAPSPDGRCEDQRTVRSRFADAAEEPSSRLVGSLFSCSLSHRHKAPQRQGAPGTVRRSTRWQAQRLDAVSCPAKPSPSDAARPRRACSHASTAARPLGKLRFRPPLAHLTLHLQCSVRACLSLAHETH